MLGAPGYTRETAPHVGGRGSPFAQIMLLSRSAQGPADFYRGLLRILSGVFGSPYARLDLRQGGECLTEEWHQGAGDPQFWKDPVERVLIEAHQEHETVARIYSAPDARLRVGLVAVPLYTPEAEVVGAVALVMRLKESTAKARISYLESLLTVASHAAGGVGPAAPPARTADSVRALGRAAEFESIEELAYHLTNTLRNRMGCHHVALGLARGNRLRLLAISGLDHVPRQSPGVRAIVMAMEECLDQRAAIAVPPLPEEPALALGTRLHVQWHHAAQRDQVASLPIRSGDEIVAVLSLRRRADEPLRSEELRELSEALVPFGPALLLLREARRNLMQHASEAGAAFARSLLRPQHVIRRWAVLAVAAALAWFAVGTWPYRVTLTGVVAPAELRCLSMPFDGKLAAVHAKPGDLVRAGAILAELETTDLRIEQDELAAQRAAAAQERVAALGRQDPVAAQLAGVTVDLCTARLAGVARRLERCVLRSPCDGTIVSGDLSTRAGDVVLRGVLLFEVAPGERWRLELAAPEWVSAELSAELAGTFCSSARPESGLPFQLERVQPHTVLRDGRNVVLAEASVTAAAGWMRPGITGYGRVELGPRPVWWVALHRVIEYVRLHLWL